LPVKELGPQLLGEEPKELHHQMRLGQLGLPGVASSRSEFFLAGTMDVMSLVALVAEFGCLVE
jgi:hypothetical protein